MFTIIALLGLIGTVAAHGHAQSIVIDGVL